MVVVIVETVVAEEEEGLVGEEETKVDMEMADGQQDHQRSHLTPPLIEERLKVLFAKYAKNLATLLLHVGLGLHKQVL